MATRRDFDTEMAWRSEKEPTYSPTRPTPRLDPAGTLRVALGIVPASYATNVIERIPRLNRCGICEKVCDGATCKLCVAVEARACAGCSGWTVAGERVCGECGTTRAA